MKIDPNAPAFPTMDAHELDKCPSLDSPGLSVRAYFAAKAMQALAGNGVLLNAIRQNEKVMPSDFPVLLAKVSVQYADALIVELNKPESK